MINTQPSTILQARLWIQKHLPMGISIMSEERRIISNDQGVRFSVSSTGEGAVISHSLMDLLWGKGSKLFTAQYAVTGSRMFSRFISDRNINKYPALKEIHSSTGVAYGLKESYQMYLSLLKKHAVLLKRFEKGRWLENQQGLCWGPFFTGVPLNEILPFFSDPAYRTQGPPVKIYQLTPSFHNALKDALTMPVGYGNCDGKILWTTPEGEAGLTGSTIEYNPKTRELNVELCWESENKEIMRELEFRVLPPKYAERNSDYFIDKFLKNVIGKEISIKEYYKEFMRPKDHHFTTHYKLTIPLNMLNGKYILTFKYKNREDTNFELYKFVLR